METLSKAESQLIASPVPGPRRILLVAPSPPPYGGMAIQAKLMETLLRLDGHHVDFFASNAGFPRLLKPLEQVAYLRAVVRTIVICVRLWKRVKQADVVHILAASRFYFFGVVSPAMIYGRILDKRVVLNYRGGDANQFFRRFGRLVRPVLRLATVLTTPSAFLAQAIYEHFGMTAQIVPNILDSSTFRHKIRTVIRPKLLVTRHLEKIYGVEVALQAFREVQRVYPEASLWIAGTGSQESHLRQLVSDWKLANVRFLGYVAHRDLGAIYDECDLLLNASFVDNFPGALLEAAGAGLVVVSTNAGGIPFMFQHEKDALLVERGDWRGLGAAVCRAIESSSLSQRLTANAASRARKCLWPEVRKSVYTAYGFLP